MNSVQQFTTSSRASLATRTLGSVSLIILLIAALGIVRSSSLPEEEAIALFPSVSRPDFKSSPALAHCSTKGFQKAALREGSRRRCEKRVQARKRGGEAGTRGQGHSVWETEGEAGRRVGGLRTRPQGGDGKEGAQETGAPGNTFVSPQSGGRCRPTGPPRCRRGGKVQGHWPR